MSNTRALQLRVLYTINSSPQYILARSPSLLRVTPVPYTPISNPSHYSDHDASIVQQTQHHQGARLLYATVSLKACLNTICRSSPEIVQDSSRDFSVYVLDPLESQSAPAPVHIPNSDSSNPATSPPGSTGRDPSFDHQEQQPRGVAVGLGLMSWALLADEGDGVAVTGTLIKLGTGQDALEVVFALRETTPMQKTSLTSALRSWGLPPEPSKRSRIHASKSHRESKHPKFNLPSNSQPHASSTTKPQDNGAICFKRDASSDNRASSSTNSASQASSPSQASSRGPFHTSSSTLNPPLSPLSLARARAKTKPPPPPSKAKPPMRPLTEAEHLLLSSTTYIGPLRKKGRPLANGGERASSSAPISSSDVNRSAVTVSIDSTPSASVSTLGNGGEPIAATSTLSPPPPVARAKPPKDLGPPFVSTPLTRKPLPDLESTPIAESNTNVTLLQILSELSSSSTAHLPHNQNAALLAALNSIDSSISLAPNHESGKIPDTQNTNASPTLVNALKQLLSAACSMRGPGAPAVQGQPHLPSRSEPSSHTHSPSKSHDDEIIVLDKENVNPTAFRRRAEREREEAKLVGTSAAIPGPSTTPNQGGNSGHSSPSAGVDRAGLGAAINLGNSSRSNEISSTSTSIAPSPSSGSGITTTVSRKRRLSDFMDDRDGERERAGKRDGHRHRNTRQIRNSSQNRNPTKQYSRLVQSDSLFHSHSNYPLNGPMTSPPRKESYNQQHGQHNGGVNSNSARHPITISDSPLRGRAIPVSASSPVRPSTNTRSQPQSRKRYVVPAWARTDTATQPRLSKEAERAIAEAEERKKEGTKEAVRKRAAAAAERDKERAREQERCSNASNLGKSEAEAAMDIRPRSEHTSSGKAITRMRPPPPPPIAASLFPVFAATDVTALSFSPDSKSPSRSSSPSRFMREPPKTPPRNRRSDVPTTPGAEGSLFTPTPKSWNGIGRLGRGFDGSPLFSPSFGSFTSPVGKGKGKTKMSPMQAIVTGQSLNIGEGVWSGGSVTGGEGEEGKDDEDIATRKPDSMLDNPDLPHSSLPVASSDVDISCDDESEDQDDDQEQHEKRQHWSGLPPSSPPPPTSPFLMPQDTDFDPCTDDDMDDPDLELPMATSDAEYGGLESELTSPSDAESPCYSAEELAAYLNMNDFSTLFTTPDSHSPDKQDKISSEMDVFDQFTYHHAQSDDSQTGAGESMDVNMNLSLDPIIQNGITDFDFTEFWKSVKPLVEENVHTNDSSNSKADPPAIGLGLQFGMQNADPQDLGIGDVDHAKLAEDVHALFSGCLM